MTTLATCLQVCASRLLTPVDDPAERLAISNALLGMVRRAHELERFRDEVVADAAESERVPMVCALPRPRPRPRPMFTVIEGGL